MCHILSSKQELNKLTNHLEGQQKVQQWNEQYMYFPLFCYRTQCCLVHYAVLTVAALCYYSNSITMVTVVT